MNSVKMDANQNSTWSTGGFKKKYRNDYVFGKTSATESEDSVALLSDTPASTKSRAELMLEVSELEKQLQKDETEYNFMINQFDHMKMFCLRNGTIPTIIDDNDSKIDDKVLINENSSSPHDSTPNSPLNDDDDKVFDYNIASENTQSYDFNPELQQITIREQEEADENSSNSDHENYFSEKVNDANNIFAVDEKLIKDEENNEDIPPIRREIHMSDISRNVQHPFQLHLANYSKSIHEEMEEHSREEVSQNQHNEEISYTDLPLNIDYNNNNNNDELFNNNSLGNVQSFQTLKNKKSRSEKRRKVSATSTNKKNLTKQDDTLYGTSRIRKKKRRVKTSNSKSTTATRDTFVNIENKKETRKFKPKGQPTIQLSKSSQHRQENITKMNQPICSDVVEIYHNNAIKNDSLSLIASKHSKLEPQGRNVVSSCNKYDQRYTAKNSEFHDNHDQLKYNHNENQARRGLNSELKNQSINNTEDNRSKNYQQAKQQATDFRSGEPNVARMIHKVECPIIESGKKMQECTEHKSTYYDVLATRNYELPTVASKMKRVNRSYLNRFNFGNIPFVVGTSVTPSYNLGLNIQETLSLIKTRNMKPGGVTPLLMNKLREGVEPVSTLLGCGGDSNEIPFDEEFPVEQMSNIYSEKMTTRDIGIPKISSINMKQPSCFEAYKKSSKIIDLTSTKKPKIQSNCCVFKKKNDNRLKLTQSDLLKQRQEELNIADSPSNRYQSITQNRNGIREIINIHDQFEAMVNKSEKLEEQMKISNDESLKKENAILEKELLAKEEEIKAVMNHYQEFKTLKQQMRLRNEKNSLVCVVTETPESSIYHQMGSRIQDTNPMFNVYRKNGWETNNNRGPSTSTRLAGMLRQIKVFQKQLKSAT